MSAGCECPTCPSEDGRVVNLTSDRSVPLCLRCFLAGCTDRTPVHDVA